MSEERCGLFKVGDIAAIIGDDSDHGSGLTQYSGLWTLVSKHFIHTASLLAGTHMGTGPRFTRTGTGSARLYKTADENNILETEATFKLRNPHYIDYSYSVTLHGKWTPGPLGDYMELSLCNYMNAVRRSISSAEENGSGSIRRYMDTRPCATQQVCLRV